MIDSLKYWLIVYASTLASRIISLKETPKDELQDEVFNQIYVDTFIKKLRVLMVAYDKKITSLMAYDIYKRL